MTMYALTVFLSAFLLFLVQPILAKYILPWFGGSPGVWNTCLLFFQVLLTAGYGFSHLLAGQAPSAPGVGYSGAAACHDRIAAHHSRKDVAARKPIRPTWHILRLLAASVGPCYFLLASISPDDAILVQPDTPGPFALSPVHALQSRFAARRSRAILL